MTTVHERGAKDLLSSILMDPAAAGVFAETRRRFAAGSYDRGHVAVIGQMFNCSAPKSWPLAQVAAYLQVHAHLGAGNYAQVDIEVGHFPAADRDRDVNAAALADLPAPFEAEVDLTQSGGDQDGWLDWNEPIRIGRSTGVSLHTANCDGWPDRVRVMTEIQSMSAPLEIGYTMPSRTMFHLIQHGAVARWPYESASIQLLVDMERLRRPTSR